MCEIYSLEIESASSKEDDRKYVKLEQTTGKLQEDLKTGHEGTDPVCFAGHCTGNIRHICSG